MNPILRDRVQRARLWMFPACIWWVLFGIGTINRLAGHPEDAPHLHASDQFRGYLWIITGVVAFLILCFDKVRDERATLAAASLLIVMPMLRAVSYTWAYWVSYSGNDNPLGVGPPWLEGDPNAYYTCLPWWVISWAIISQVIDWRGILRKLRHLTGGHS